MRIERKTISEEDYAKICLNCPYRDCISNKVYGCELLNPYKKLTQYEKGGKNGTGNINKCTD